MRNLLILFALTVIVAGCNGNASENSRISQDSIRMVRELDSLKRVASADSAAHALAIAKANAQNQAAPAGTATTDKKKGWSSAAKGAVIGGVIGAGTGIIIDKKDGRGAAIGGAVGAGTGYVIGREQDKKSGRVKQ